MKFYSFYLFYFLAIFLLFVGYKNSSAEVIGPELSYGDTAIIKEKLWPYFLTTSFLALLTGLIYHFWFNTGRHVHNLMIVLHFIFSSFGVLLSFNIYRIAILLANSGAPDTASFAFGNSAFFISLLGPILLITSLILFIVGLAKARRAKI